MSEIVYPVVQPLEIAPVFNDIDFRITSAFEVSDSQYWTFLIRFVIDGFDPVEGDILRFRYNEENYDFTFQDTPTLAAHLPTKANPLWNDNVQYIATLYNYLANNAFIQEHFDIIGNQVNTLSTFDIYFRDKVFRDTLELSDGVFFVPLGPPVLTFSGQLIQIGIVGDNPDAPLSVELFVDNGDFMEKKAELLVPFIRESVWTHRFNLKGYLFSLLEYYFKLNLNSILPAINGTAIQVVNSIVRGYSVRIADHFFKGFAWLGGFRSDSIPGYAFEFTHEYTALPFDVNATKTPIVLDSRILSAEKEVTETQREFIYILIQNPNIPEGTWFANFDLHYTDGTSDLEAKQVFISNFIDNNQEKKVVMLPVGYSQISSLVNPAKKLFKWVVGVYCDNSESYGPAFNRSYFLVPNEYQEQYFMFRNHMGGFETFRCLGKQSHSVNFAKKVYEMQPIDSMHIDNVDYTKYYKEQYSVFIGNLTLQQANDFKDFFNSRYKYILDLEIPTFERYIPIVLTDGSIGVYDEANFLHAVKFTYVKQRVAEAYSRFTTQSPPLVISDGWGDPPPPPGGGDDDDDDLPEV